MNFLWFHFLQPFCDFHISFISEGYEVDGENKENKEENLEGKMVDKDDVRVWSSEETEDSGWTRSIRARI